MEESKSASSTNSVINAGKNRFVNLLFINGQLKQTTFKKTIICYGIFGIIFLILSILCFVLMGKITYISLKYYDHLNNSTDCQKNCQHNEICECNIEITDEIKPPIYVMYKVGNLYQNHRRYIQSRSRKQLANTQNPNDQSQTIAHCLPYAYNWEMNKTKSWNETLLQQNAIASPCGAIALTYFQDEFTIKNSQNQTITITDEGINWPGQQDKYSQSQESADKQWTDPTKPRFMVWMRTSGIPNFAKLWGIINTAMPAGNYTLNIINKYESKPWYSNRHFILTTNSTFGGKNNFMGCTLLGLSLACFAAVIFFWRQWTNTIKQ